ncbi:MAG: hypothetical protein LBL00_08355, partial [Endomicrobium sp.]|nr:hypothetical protein [Endomicrobium sp.]
FNSFAKTYDKDGKFLFGEDHYVKGNWVSTAIGNIQQITKGFSYSYGLNETEDGFVFYNVTGLAGYNAGGRYDSLTVSFENAGVKLAAELNGNEGAYYTGLMEIRGTDYDGNFTGSVGMYYDAFTGAFTDGIIKKINIDYIFQQGAGNKDVFEEFLKANPLLNTKSFSQQLAEFKKSDVYSKMYYSLTNFALDKTNNSFTGMIGVYGGQFDFDGNLAKYKISSNNDIIQGKLSGSDLIIRYENGKPAFYAIDDILAVVTKINGDVTSITAYNEKGAFEVNLNSTKPNGYYTDPSTSDQVHFSGDINLTYKKNGDKWVCFDVNGKETEGKITGTYRHYVKSIDSYQDLKAEFRFEIDDEGLAVSPVLKGKATTENKGAHFDAAAPGAKGGESRQDAGDTRAAIITDAFGNMDVIGDISIRGLSLVVVGEGAVALSSSVLLSNDNLVKTTENYTMVDSQWKAGEYRNGTFEKNEASFEYLNPNSASQNIKDNIKLFEGFSYELDLSGKFKGDIPATYAQALVSYVSNKGRNIDVVITDADKANNATSEMYGVNLHLEKGNKLQIGLSGSGEGQLGLFWNDENPLVRDNFDLPKGVGADFGSEIKDKVNLIFNNGDELALGVGLNGAYRKHALYVNNTPPVLVNTSAMNVAGVVFSAGGIRISVEENGELTAKFYNSGKTEYVYADKFNLIGHGIRIIAGATAGDNVSIVGRYGLVNIARNKIDMSGEKQPDNTVGASGEGESAQTNNERQAQIWDGKDSLFFGKTIKDGDDWYVEEGSTFWISEENLDLSNNSLAQNLLNYKTVFQTVGNVFLEGSDIFGFYKLPSGHVDSGAVVIKAIGADGNAQWASYGEDAVVSGGNLDKPGSSRITYNLNQYGFVTEKTEKNLAGTTRQDGSKYISGIEETIFGSKKDENTGVNVIGGEISHTFKNAVVVGNAGNFTGVKYNVKSDGTLSDANYKDAKFQIDGKSYDVKESNGIPLVQVPRLEWLSPMITPTVAGYEYFYVDVNGELHAVDIENKTVHVKDSNKTFTADAAGFDELEAYVKGHIYAQDKKTAGLLNTFGSKKEGGEMKSFDALVESNKEKMMVTSKAGVETENDLKRRFLDAGINVTDIKVNYAPQWSFDWRNGGIRVSYGAKVTIIEGEAVHTYPISEIDAVVANRSNNKIANSLMSGMLKQGQHIVDVYDSKGYVSSIIIGDMQNKYEQPIGNNNIEIYVNGKKHYISENNINMRVRGESGKVTTVEGSPKSENVKVTEYRIDGKTGAITVVEINTKQNSFSTSTILTEKSFNSLQDLYSGKSSFEQQLTSYVGLHARTGMQILQNLYNYAMGTFTGSLSLGSTSNGKAFITINVYNEGGYKYSIINCLGKDEFGNINKVINYQTIYDVNSSALLSNSIYEVNVRSMPSIKLGFDDKTGQVKNAAAFKEIINYYMAAYKNGNGKVVRASVQQYNADGSLSGSFSTNSGSAYVDKNGVVQSLFAIDSKGVGIQLALPSLYSSINSDLASTLGAKKAEMLANYNIDGKFGDIELKNILLLEFDDGSLWNWWRNTIAVIDIGSGRYFSSRTTEDTAYIEYKELRYTGDSTDVIAVNMSGSEIQISLSKKTQTKDSYYVSSGGTDDYPVYVPAQYSRSAIQQITISHSLNGSASIDSFIILNSKTGEFRRIVETIGINGERTSEDIHAANSDISVNSHNGKFILPTCFEVSGDSFSEVINKAGQRVSFITFEGRLENIIWDNKSNKMLRYSPVNYKQVTYTSKGSTQTPFENPSAWERGDTRVLNGGSVYNLFSKDDIDKVGLDSSLAKYVTFPKGSKNNNEKVENYYILSGVTEEVYDPKGILVSKEEKTTVEQINETVYSTDGLNYKPLSEIDWETDKIYSSRTRTEVYYGNVTRWEIIDGQETGVKTDII